MDSSYLENILCDKLSESLQKSNPWLFQGKFQCLPVRAKGTLLELFRIAKSHDGKIPGSSRELAGEIASRCGSQSAELLAAIREDMRELIESGVIELGGDFEI